MILRRVAVGVLFNTKQFKVSARAGDIVDNLVEYSRKQSERGGLPFFIQLMSGGDVAQSFFRLTEPGGNYVEVSPAQVVFNRVSSADGAALNLDKVIDEFSDIYKIIKKDLGDTSIRRIGLIGEYLVSSGGVSFGGAVDLVGRATNLSAPEYSRRCHISFSDLEVKSGDLDLDQEDYWNHHIGLYNSEIDERPVVGGVIFSLDTQKYYNPAKRDAVREILSVVRRFKDKKISVKKQLAGLGFIDG